MEITAIRKLGFFILILLWISNFNDINFCIFTVFEMEVQYRYDSLQLGPSAETSAPKLFIQEGQN